MQDTIIWKCRRTVLPCGACSGGKGLCGRVDRQFNPISAFPLCWNVWIIGKKKTFVREKQASMLDMLGCNYLWPLKHLHIELAVMKIRLLILTEESPSVKKNTSTDRKKEATVNNLLAPPSAPMDKAEAFLTWAQFSRTFCRGSSNLATI